MSPVTTDLIGVDDLIARVLASVDPLPPRPVPLLDTPGLLLREDVRSGIALPGFDNSAMDGYAVVAADLAGAGEATPVRLPVVGEIGAGRSGPDRVAPGSVAKIMTGAPMPAGADAVVPYEWTDRGADQVVVTRAPSVGQHVRRAGDDVGAGDLVVPSGTRLAPRHLGVLAAVGRADVLVSPRPRVVVVSTGSEVREPGTPLGPGSVYDANSFLVAASGAAAGAVARRVGVVGDDPAAFLDVLDAALGGDDPADLVVTSGGVSQGDFDVVKAALRDLGSMWFGSVRMQPGKPQGFGRVGERGVPIFTVPGNPVSSFVSTQVFVVPAIRKLLGLEPWVRPPVRAMLTAAMRSPAGRQQYARGRWTPDGRVEPVGGPGSHLVGGLAAANALIVVPADVSSVAAGEVVDVVVLDTAS